MRLLNIKTLQFEEFSSDATPPYAILSHTWTPSEEVTYNEFQLLRSSAGSPAGMYQLAQLARSMTVNAPEQIVGRSGFRKIRDCCVQALKHKVAYLWADTCCIDKSSSAELSEAINSMFSWYKNAVVCLVYLSDYSMAEPDQLSRMHSFNGSRWWKRGWTLQELLAPANVHFFDQSWHWVGTKVGLADVITHATGIDRDILVGVDPISSVSVAKRMSWASERKTTRPEDEAYCLMGLFSVNMSMIYGEGKKAFLRLQEEIMRHSDDQSIFAWTDPDASGELRCGLLAESPSRFRHSSKIVPFIEPEADDPFSVSNKGLSIDLHLSRIWGKFYRASLCCKLSGLSGKCVCLYLERMSPKSRQYVRVLPQKHFQAQERGQLQKLFVKQVPYTKGSTLSVYIELRNGPSRSQSQYQVRDIMPLGQEEHRRADLGFVVQRESGKGWIPNGKPFRWQLPERPGSLAALLWFEREPGDNVYVLLGSSWQAGLSFDAMTSPYKNSISLPPEVVKYVTSRYTERFANTSHLVGDRHLVEINTEWQDGPWGAICFVDIKIEAAPEAAAKKHEDAAAEESKLGFAIFARQNISYAINSNIKGGINYGLQKGSS